jgi:hypothetical protein
VSAPPDRAAQRALLARSVRARPGAVLWDEATSTLLDVPSGKTLHLDWARIARVEERADAASGRSYLALLLDAGAEIAIADAGVAFPPSTRATGPLEGLPAAVCFRDLLAAEARLVHFIGGHPGERADRTHVQVFLFCLAVVEGARAVGFDVSPEERRLEGILAELEKRRGG